MEKKRLFVTSITDRSGQICKYAFVSAICWSVKKERDMLKKHGKLWSKGPTFDEAIIRHAFQQAGYDDFPIGYSGSRCVRTIDELKRHLDLTDITRIGSSHNALNDARFQVEGVIQLFRAVQR